MEDKVNEVDFVNKLILKNQLITLSLESLIDVYSDVSNYLIFVDTISNILTSESAFLYLDDKYIKKIEDVLQIHRFDFDDREIYDLINNVIVCLNTITNEDKNYKKMIVTNYCKYQEDVRSCSFSKFEDLLYALSYDAIVFVNIKFGEKNILRDDLVIGTINYIIENCPQLFLDESIKKNTLTKLDVMSNKSKFFDIGMKILTKDAKNKVKKIKEE